MPLAKMMRIAGRTAAGLAKAIKVDDEGRIETVSELTGSVVEESFDYYNLNGATYQFSESRSGIGLYNTGSKNIILIINDTEIKVRPGDSFYSSFATSFNEVEVWEELVYYNMELTDEGLIRDISGNNYHATPYNTTVADGLAPNSIESVEGNGTDAYVKTPSEVRSSRKDAVKIEFYAKANYETAFPEQWMALVNGYRDSTGKNKSWYIGIDGASDQLVFGSIYTDDQVAIRPVVPASDLLGITFRVVAERTNHQISLKLYNSDSGTLLEEVSFAHPLYFWDKEGSLNPVTFLADNRTTTGEYFDGTMDMVRILQKPEPGSFHAIGMR